MRKKIILIGAGGYAKSVIDSIDDDKYEIVGFIDEFSDEKKHLDIPVIGKSFDDIKDLNECSFFISIGDNFHRKKWFDRIEKLGLNMINVIDKSAIVSCKATIGKGCFIGKMAIVNSMSVIGDNTIINSKALVEHGCTVGNHVNISTNTVINGDVKVGDGSTLYSSSVVIGQRSIGEWSIVGAGGVVTKNIGDYKVAVGIPAKVIKDAKYEE